MAGQIGGRRRWPGPRPLCSNDREKRHVQDDLRRRPAAAVPSPSVPTHSGHPLELIAFFRRFRPSVLRNLIYTFIWNMGFIAVFSVLDPAVRAARASGARALGQLRDRQLHRLSDPWRIRAGTSRADAVDSAARIRRAQRLLRRHHHWRRVWRLLAGIHAAALERRARIHVFGPRCNRDRVAEPHHLRDPGIDLLRARAPGPSRGGVPARARARRGGRASIPPGATASCSKRRSSRTSSTTRSPT